MLTASEDVTEYPNNHSYFAFATTDNISKPISTVLETVQKKFERCTLATFLEGFCDCIDDAIMEDSREDSDSNCDFGASCDGSGPGDDFDASSDDENADWDEFADVPVISHCTNQKQLRADLRAAKSAGFKVGYLGDLEDTFVVSISCRVAKLGISQDAMQMWNVSPEQFLTVLLRYPKGYRGLDQIMSQSQTSPPSVHIHVGLCDTYKPTVLSVPDIVQPNILHDILCPSTSDFAPKSAIKSTFITEPMEALLNDRFLDFIKNRLEHGFSWTGAELFYNDAQGKKLNATDVRLAKYRVSEEWSNSTPNFVKGDELRQTRDSSRLSLPLIAMQYTLRRFVKCTEFCLTCYCKIDAGYEALKPYVCSTPLCLYQYMQLGMGPRLEWEIVSQPYVVDMLVSFAYARASAGKLTDFPSGLGLKVPFASSRVPEQKPWTAILNTGKMSLMTQEKHNLKVGEWVAIKADDGLFCFLKTPSLCCAVLGIHADIIELSQPIAKGFGNQNDHRPQWNQVLFMPYRAKFDDLDNLQKNQAIMALLDTLPDVLLMKSFITSGPRPEHNKSLASWIDRICPSALYVLRWIVASNQSCIVCDDDPDHQVTGMGNHMQFRLAQGSPDKESRFIQAVKSSSQGQFPTFFAWHGSPVSNWHSILRQGLNFDQILHGRAHGNGVYMARSINESQGYTGSPPLANWSQSLLGIKSAISLNEVVNAPHAFQSSSPFYVVSQLDWIQPRYLFIFCKDLTSRKKHTSKPSKVYNQDPEHTPIGTDNSAVSIPISALSFRQDQANEQASTHASRKRKVSPGWGPRVSDTSNDCDSVATLADDLCLLQSDSEDEAGEPDCVKMKRRIRAPDPRPKTNFRPGTLQPGHLKLLGAPSYATTTATQSLQRHLKVILKVQDREPLYELGWYVDATLVNTIYQWIVEFHSFDSSLPLAQDLKRNKLTSIVMEIRFPPQFPMSPPFIRVIRPRFIPFMQGGGGHVTAGGAMCMELLTSSGWLPTITMESVLLQVRLALCSTDPQPARLEYSGEYSFGESMNAYKRACQTHGWEVPHDFYRIQQA